MQCRLVVLIPLLICDVCFGLTFYYETLVTFDPLNNKDYTRKPTPTTEFPNAIQETTNTVPTTNNNDEIYAADNRMFNEVLPITTPLQPEIKHVSTANTSFKQPLKLSDDHQENLDLFKRGILSPPSSPDKNSSQAVEGSLHIIGLPKTTPLNVISITSKPLHTKLRPAFDDSSSSILICGSKQRYVQCGRCEPSCYDPYPNCTAQCHRGCFCDTGLVRAPNGTCVLLSQCPAAELFLGGMQDLSVEDCGSNEEYLSCGWCEPTCSDMHPYCPQTICTRGCLCRPPMVRHPGGACVDPSECKPKKCRQPSEVHVCLYGCEPRCDRRLCLRRPRGCVVGCYCKPGLLRDRDGTCVAPDRCNYRKHNSFRN